MDKLVETKRERFWNPEAWARDQWVKAEAARLAPGSRVLDAGAGASKYAPFFAHCQYETQDFCQYEGPLVKYTVPINHVCDLVKIPLPDASLDAILCTEVLEHVPDPIAALREFRRLLKTGGKLFLTAPHGTTLHMAPYHFYGGFTHYWYRHWLPQCGFVIDSIVPQGGPGSSVVAYLRAYYGSWQNRETGLPGLQRLASLAARAFVKVPVHYLLPWLLPKFDHHLDRFQICVGLMVAATRGVDSPRATSVTAG